jgi:hypothetical protein
LYGGVGLLNELINALRFEKMHEFKSRYCTRCRHFFTLQPA